MSRFCPVCHKYYESSYRVCPLDGARLFSMDDAGVRVGTCLAGRWDLQAELGEGGTGTVFLAVDRQDQARRAIKVLRRELSQDPEQLSRFMAEGRIAQTLTARFTRKVLDLGTAEDGNVFLVMEYLEGRTLADLLREEGPLSLPRAAKVVAQVAVSLAEAHAAGIVHRDLKPANIMLVRSADGEEVRVVDFGVARRQELNLDEVRTRQGFAMGTPAYMSPECILGDPVDGRSDEYALGVVLFEMLTGQRPFADATPMKTMLRHLHDRPPAPRAVNPAAATNPQVDAVLQRALAKAPAERFPGVREMSRALQEAADSGAVPPLGPSLPDDLTPGPVPTLPGLERVMGARLVNQGDTPALALEAIREAAGAPAAPPVAEPVQAVSAPAAPPDAAPVAPPDAAPDVAKDAAPANLPAAGQVSSRSPLEPPQATLETPSEAAVAGMRLGAESAPRGDTARPRRVDQPLRLQRPAPERYFQRLDHTGADRWARLGMLGLALVLALAAAWLLLRPRRTLLDLPPDLSALAEVPQDAAGGDAPTPLDAADEGIALSAPRAAEAVAPPPRSDDPAVAIVRVSSNPPGALIYMDNRLMGVTPKELRFLRTRGKADLKLVLGGFRPHKVTADLDRDSQFHVDLVPLPQAPNPRGD
jgi:predicted Ser/Thr protein kinase